MTNNLETIMSISWHPTLKEATKVLKQVLKDLSAPDINYVLGGDGTLFTYLDPDNPNMLISTTESVGHYSFAKINLEQNLTVQFTEIIKKYMANPEKYHQTQTTIKVKGINDLALNEVLITEGLHKVSKMMVNGKELKNSGLMIYTHDGYHGFAKNTGARHVKKNNIAITEIFPYKTQVNGQLKKDEVIINLEERNRDTSFKIYFDCKDINPFKKGCTTLKRKINHEPHTVNTPKELTINKGPSVIIVQ